MRTNPMEAYMKLTFLTLAILTSFALSAKAEVATTQPQAIESMDDLDPFAPNINETLKEMDEDYQKSTGQSPFINQDILGLLSSGCYRLSCEIYINVNKDSQTAHLYVHGRLQGTWAVSTGVPGHGTPDFDTHPDGRIYDAYSSTKYPGGDYNGLGNMPYAVFIEGGFAIHGTPQGNWPKLGSRASHGCIRIHPENARYFNRLVRANGIYNTWITVE